jgi:hypothetical protein
MVRDTVVGWWGATRDGAAMFGGHGEFGGDERRDMVNRLCASAKGVFARFGGEIRCGARRRCFESAPCELELEREC